MSMLFLFQACVRGGATTATTTAATAGGFSDVQAGLDKSIAGIAVNYINAPLACQYTA